MSLRAVVALAAFGAAAPLAGQGRIRPSQVATVTQRVGFTDIALTYRRPVARGRTLFGGVVNWGRVWTPGADSATTITVSRDILVNGARLPAGRYSVWVIPDTGRWTVVFNAEAVRFHIPYPGEASDVLRLTVQPERGDHVESLAFYFPTVDADSAVLRLHWGETVVPLHVVAPDLTPIDEDGGSVIPWSQRGELTQRVGSTDLAVAYRRPVARGRRLFGGVVAWGRTWNPGADSATTVSLSRNLEVNGQPLAAGRYSLWMEPTDSTWTVIFNTAVDIFHTPYPGTATDALRLTVRPDSASDVETLLFLFPMVDADSASLVMRWGRTAVPLRLRAASR